MRALSLYGNPNISIGQATFHGLDYLEILFLGANNYVNLERVSIQGLKNLQELTLGGSIDSIEINNFHGLERLMNLDLSHSHIQDISRANFQGLKKLIQLDLSFNSIHLYLVYFIYGSTIAVKMVMVMIMMMIMAKVASSACHFVSEKN